MPNLRRRLLFGPLAIALLAVPGGLIAGRAADAFAGQPSVSSANVGMSGMSGMNMASETAAAATAPVLMLHRTVIHLTIHNFAFSPAKVVVSPGTRIIWTNQDSDAHTVDSLKNVWSSPVVDPEAAPLPASSRLTCTRQFRLHHCTISSLHARQHHRVK